MSIDRIILIIYGLFLLFGAYFGWKAGSKPSLISGSISGILVLVGVYVSTLNPRLGYGLLTALSSLLVVVFLMRFLKTYKVMPMGMLLVISLVAAIISLMRLLQK